MTVKGVVRPIAVYRPLAARERVYDLMGAREKQAEDLDAFTALVRELGDARRDAEVSQRRAKYAEANLRVRLTCWHILTTVRDLRARSILAPAHDALS